MDVMESLEILWEVNTPQGVLEEEESRGQRPFSLGLRLPCGLCPLVWSRSQSLFRWRTSSWIVLGAGRHQIQLPDF